MSHTRTLRRAATCLAVLALASCAGRPARDAALLTEQPPSPAFQDCRVDRAPETLPAAHALVDTAALAAAVRELHRSGSVPAGYVLFSMGYAPDGANIRRALIEHSVSPALADTLQELVFAHRRTLPPTEGEWGVRMRIDLAPLRFRVGRREVCPPRALNRGVLSAAGLAGSRERPLGSADLRPGLTLWMRVRVDERGRVTDARLEGGPLRPGLPERALLNYAYSLAFDPAAEDGRPVPGEVRIRVRLPSW